MAASIRCTPSSWRFAPRPALNNPDCSRKTDCTFNSNQRRASSREDVVAGPQAHRLGNSSLHRRHRPGTGTSMGKDERRELVN